MSTCRHIERARKRLELLAKVLQIFNVSFFQRSQIMTSLFVHYLDARAFDYELDYVGHVSQFNVTCLCPRHRLVHQDFIVLVNVFLLPLQK